MNDIKIRGFKDKQIETVKVETTIRVKQVRSKRTK